jgi:molybdopterin synthase catalytic subunit
MIDIQVTAEPFSPEAEVTRFIDDSADNGALVTFTGYCRSASHRGAVTQLELEHYPGFTEREIRRLTTTVALKHSVPDVLVIHRVGIIPAGMPIVLVAAASPHRAAAFAAVEELMDHLKTDAPFWKKEIGPSGSRWIEPTDEDLRRREGHFK